MRLVVLILPHYENQVKTKHVESSLVPRLDEGSSPSISTTRTNHQPLTNEWGKRWGKIKRNAQFRAFLFLLYIMNERNDSEMSHKFKHDLVLTGY